MTEEWRFFDAHLEVECVVSPHSSPMPHVRSLPRIGAHFAVPASFDRIRWLGMGPGECYCDRKHCAAYGVHDASIDDMHTPYSIPGENGGRADVKWARIYGSSGSTSNISFSYMALDDQAHHPVKPLSGGCDRAFNS